ncbi:MAG: hypothetical protein EBU01_13430, partial [Crocinitomicaceae bacterium]|nr:hypothetical protein [Crocinitomicaceae bacterium]
MSLGTFGKKSKTTKAPVSGDVNSPFSINSIYRNQRNERSMVISNNSNRILYEANEVPLFYPSVQNSSTRIETISSGGISNRVVMDENLNKAIDTSEFASITYVDDN